MSRRLFGVCDLAPELSLEMMLGNDEELLAQLLVFSPQCSNEQKSRHTQKHYESKWIEWKQNCNSGLIKLLFFTQAVLIWSAVPFSFRFYRDKTCTVLYPTFDPHFKLIRDLSLKLCLANNRPISIIPICWLFISFSQHSFLPVILSLMSSWLWSAVNSPMA